jgi:hypothetical protein
VTRGHRELALATTVVALVFACTAQIRRSDKLPLPPSMLAFVTAPPRSDVLSRTMSFHARMNALDTTVQELRLETHRSAFTDKLAQIVTAIGTVQDSTSNEVTSDDIERLRQLVDETIDAIEQRLEARLDDQDVQQHLAGTVYELRRRMESVETWFRHSRRL